MPTSSYVMDISQHSPRMWNTSKNKCIILKKSISLNSKTDIFDEWNEHNRVGISNRPFKRKFLHG